MNWVDRIFIWLGGYRPQTVSGDHPEDYEPIAKIGAAVLFATLVATFNWGVAGWVYADGTETNIRFIVAGVSSAFGAAIVLVFDRGFVYFADASGDMRRIKLLVYGAFRIVVIIAVGSITAQAVMPMVLGSELKAHALHMVENGEKQRVLSLNTQFNVGAKEASVKDASEEVSRLQKAVTNVPADIQRRLTAAQSCWREYANQKSSLIDSGLSTEDVRDRLSGKAAICARDTTSATVERDAYFTRMRKQLVRATDNKQAHEAELSDATSMVKTRTERARNVEMESFTPRSSVVLWSLLESNPGARVKWFIVSFLLLVCELLPLIQKFQAGQSNVGRRVSSNRRLRTIESNERLNQREHDYAVSVAVNNASLRAIQEAMTNPRVRAIFAQAFAANIAAFAPTEAVRAMMRDLEARHVNVEEFMHRFPRYAAIISQAWSKAVKQASEILAGGVRAGSANGVPT